MSTENYFTHHAEREAGEAENSLEPTLPAAGGTLGDAGRILLLVIVVVMGIVVAAPVLTTYLMNTPVPPEGLRVMGLSYHSLVMILLLSSACMATTLTFFFRFSISRASVWFLLLLFCCYPMVAGLKNNLTLVQALQEITLFSGWPFFLRPMYIFISIVLPVVILSLAALQIRRLVRREPGVLAFFFTSLYLGIAAFIGFSGLGRAGHATLFELLKRPTGSLSSGFAAPADSNESRVDFQFPAGERPGRESPGAKHGASRSPDPERRLSPAAPGNRENGTEFNASIETLEKKTDRILSLIEEIKVGLTLKAENGDGAQPADTFGNVSVPSPVDGDRLAPAGEVKTPVGTAVPQLGNHSLGADTASLSEIRENIRNMNKLSVDMNRLLSRFDQRRIPPPGVHSDDPTDDNGRTAQLESVTELLKGIKEELSHLSGRMIRLSTTLTQVDEKLGAGPNVPKLDPNVKSDENLVAGSNVPKLDQKVKSDENFEDGSNVP